MSTPRALWLTFRVVLALGAAVALLAGAVLLVLAMAEIGDGRTTPFLLALAGGLLGLGLTWLLGRAARYARWKAHDVAIAEHTAAIRFAPASPASHHNRGLECHRKGDFARAIAHFEAAIRLDPTLADAHVGRVNAYGAIGQFDRVVADYTAAIRRDPGDAVAYCARATAYNGLGQSARSIPDATEAIRLAPLLYLGHDARGWGLLQRSAVRALKRFGFLTAEAEADCRQAVADFTEAIRLMPRAWDCYQGRAKAYRALGEREKADADEGRAWALQRQ